MRNWMPWALAILALLVVGCTGGPSLPGRPVSAPARGAIQLQPKPVPGSMCSDNAPCREIHVVTVPGKTQCRINSDQIGCATYDPAVGGFPQAPSLISGMPHANEALVDESGKFDWADGGEDGCGVCSPHPEGDDVLQYGQTYTAAGWTITSTEQGVTFKNDRTGHGMSISIDNATVNAF